MKLEPPAWSFQDKAMGLSKKHFQEYVWCLKFLNTPRQVANLQTQKVGPSQYEGLSYKRLVWHDMMLKVTVIPLICPEEKREFVSREEISLLKYPSLSEFSSCISKVEMRHPSFSNLLSLLGHRMIHWTEASKAYKQMIIWFRNINSGSSNLW